MLSVVGALVLVKADQLDIHQCAFHSTLNSQLSLLMTVCNDLVSQPFCVMCETC